MADAVMPTRFRYRAWDPTTGILHQGVQSGESTVAIRSHLRNRGWEPEHIEPILAQPSPLMNTWKTVWSRSLRSQRRMVLSELCEALGSLLQVGIPLDQALVQLAASPFRSKTETALLNELAESLRSGLAFDEACAQHPSWFDSFDVALIAAGQRAGELAPVLQSIAKFHQRSGASSQRLVTALAYPFLVALSGFAVFIFLTQSVLPRIANILTGSRSSVPWLTAHIMSLGDFLLWAWPFLIILAVSLTLLLSKWASTIPTHGRLGKFVHGNAWARFRARVRVAVSSAALGRLLRAGVPLSEALMIVAHTAADKPLKALLSMAATEVERGQDLSLIMANSPLVDPEFSHLLQLGEGSGDLPGMLDRIAERYQQSSERAAERLAALAGPIALLVLATLIGVLVLAVGQALSRVADLV